MLKNFVHYGFEHWGSDTHGVSATRRFLLEWLSYLCRYCPEPLMANPPQKINIRPIMLNVSCALLLLLLHCALLLRHEMFNNLQYVCVMCA